MKQNVFLYYLPLFFLFIFCQKKIGFEFENFTSEEFDESYFSGENLGKIKILEYKEELIMTNTFKVYVLFYYSICGEEGEEIIVRFFQGDIRSFPIFKKSVKKSIERSILSFAKAKAKKCEAKTNKK